MLNPHSTVGPPLVPDSQCGGTQGNCEFYTCLDAPYPGYTCPAGYGCVRQDERFWQCRRTYGTQAPTSQCARCPALLAGSHAS